MSAKYMKQDFIKNYSIVDPSMTGSKYPVQSKAVYDAMNNIDYDGISKMDYGTYTFPNNHSEYEILFNTTFSEAPAVKLNYNYSGSGAYYVITEITTTGFKVILACDYTHTINWIAIGR